MSCKHLNLETQLVGQITENGGEVVDNQREVLVCLDCGIELGKYTPDPIETAKLFVEYSETRKKLEELEAKISRIVMLAQETQKIAGVTATYYKQSAPVDWQAACLAAKVPQEIIDKHTKLSPTISWAKVAEEAGVEGLGFEIIKDARVVIK